MKRMLLLVLILGLSFSSCEKDDICDANTPTTPRLIIDFYNIESPLDTKNVTNLLLVGKGETTGIKFTGVSKVHVPLKLTEDSTEYSFILNSGNSNPSLIYTDILQFNYSRKTIYVSRACGYKTIFDLIKDTDSTTPNPFVLNNDPNKIIGNWIYFITVAKYNLETENETHIKIYF